MADSVATAERNRQIAEAEALRLTGRTSEADALFRGVLATRPLHVEANLGAGRCAWAEGRASLALTFFAAAAKGGKYLWPLLQFATDCRKAGDMSVARAAYREAAELMPQRHEPQFGLAVCARQLGDKRAAAEFQARGCALVPDDMNAKTDLGRDLHELQRLDEAAEVLDAVLARQPDSTRALRLAATVARNRGDTERALLLLERAESSEPEAIGPMIEHIAVHRERGEMLEARRLADAVLKREPGNVAAWVQLGLLHRACDDVEQALRAFEQALVLDPANVSVTLQVARELRTLGHEARSDALAEQALTLDSKGTQALSFQAERAMAINDAGVALDCYDNAIKRATTQVSLYIGASHALARLGRLADGIELLERAAVHCGPSVALYVRRGNMLRQAGHLTEALAVCSFGLTAFPANSLLWESVLRLQVLAGEEGELDELLAQAPAGRDSERAAMAALAGDLATERGDLAAAVNRYGVAAQLQPENVVHRINLARASLSCLDVDAAAEHLQRLDEMQITATRHSSAATASTSLLNNVLRDYQRDPMARERLAVMPRPCSANIDMMLALCREFPGNTLLAAAALQAVWASGALAEDRPLTGATPIPLRVMQFWEEPEQPADIVDLMQSWSTALPIEDYRRFDLAAAREFVAANCDAEVLLAFDRCASPIARSDFFRLAYLAHEGGIYADAFDRCNAPVRALVPDRAELVLYRGELGLLSNGFMAAVPKHPVLRTALKLAVGAINDGDPESPWVSIGPGAITRGLAQWLANDTAAIGVVRVWSRHAMFRSVALNCLWEWWQASMAPKR